MQVNNDYFVFSTFLHTYICVCVCVCVCIYIYVVNQTVMENNT